MVVAVERMKRQAENPSSMSTEEKTKMEKEGQEKKDVDKKAFKNHFTEEEEYKWMKDVLYKTDESKTHMIVSPDGFIWCHGNDDENEGGGWYKTSANVNPWRGFDGKCPCCQGKWGDTGSGAASRAEVAKFFD